MKVQWNLCNYVDILLTRSS